MREKLDSRLRYTGKRIKKMRKFHDFSLSQVSNYLQIDVKTLEDIEDGKNTINLSKLMLLSDLFGCSVYYLSGDSNDDEALYSNMKRGSKSLNEDGLKAIAAINRIQKNMAEMNKIEAMRLK